MTVETFNSSTTWEAPTGVTSVEVECWGAGGSCVSEGGAFAGGGGGGGAYSKKTVSVTPGNSYTVNVGAVGAEGEDGGDSWFSSSGTVLAKGGKGSSSRFGGVGGSSSEGIGDTKFSGGDGGDALDIYLTGGGGGSSAGTSSNGTNGSDGSESSGGSGGIAPSGGGNGGAGGDEPDSGTNGSAPGGGGGGAGFNGAQAGFGAAGRIVLTYEAGSEEDPVVITTLTLPDGVVGEFYSESVCAEDGTTPYSWSVISGSVPTGLSLGSSGTPCTTLSGTPSAIGTFNFTVQVTDDTSDTDTQAYTIEIIEHGGGGDEILEFGFILTFQYLNRILRDRVLNTEWIGYTKVIKDCVLNYEFRLNLAKNFVLNRENKIRVDRSQILNIERKLDVRRDSVLNIERKLDVRDTNVLNISYKFSLFDNNIIVYSSRGDIRQSYIVVYDYLGELLKNNVIPISFSALLNKNNELNLDFLSNIQIDKIIAWSNLLDVYPDFIFPFTNVGSDTPIHFDIVFVFENKGGGLTSFEIPNVVDPETDCEERDNVMWWVWLRPNNNPPNWYMMMPWLDTDDIIFPRSITFSNHTLGVYYMTFTEYFICPYSNDLPPYPDRPGNFINEILVVPCP